MIAGMRHNFHVIMLICTAETHRDYCAFGTMPHASFIATSGTPETRDDRWAQQHFADSYTLVWLTTHIRQSGKRRIRGDLMSERDESVQCGTSLQVDCETNYLDIELILQFHLCFIVTCDEGFSSNN